MTIGLGIDTGGTYTDAVLLDHGSGQVLAAAKALTTWPDLAQGIGEAVEEVLAQHPGPVHLVALSTTLATNALVEGRGSPAALLLIGYDPDLIARWGFRKDLATPHVAFIPGGHRADGSEARPLDRDALLRAVRQFADQVEAFAVSGYFAVRNPAHEQVARDLIRAETGKPVTCGHELTTRLNAIRRATTAALNARLIPLLQDLILAVQETLRRLKVEAPLMVVKGDGSLVAASVALERPIETVLSGPAASVVGAQFLASHQEMLVVDMGGTTTDIALVTEGRPRLNPRGALVGGWRTMVEAIDVLTLGLGGDSQVSVDRGGDLQVGPRRVVPLSLLAARHQGVLEELQRQAEEGARSDLAGVFVTTRRDRAGRHSLGEAGDLLRPLRERGPRSLLQLAAELGRPTGLVLHQLEGLEARGLVVRAGLTPTDALHVLGEMRLWSAEAARLGAGLLARRLRLEAEALCREVVRRTALGAAQGLLARLLSAGDGLDEGLATRLVEAGLEPERSPLRGLKVGFRVQMPVVGIGAPAAAYLPEAARRLNAALEIPEHAPYANALGAVVGGVVQRVRALVLPMQGGQAYRLHLGDLCETFPNLEAAVERALAVGTDMARRLARQAGAREVEVRVERKDVRAPVASGWGEEVHLETELLFTAAGRPSAAR